MPGFVNVDDRAHVMDRPSDQLVSIRFTESMRYLVVVRCQRRGEPAVRNGAPGSPAQRVRCSRPAGDRFEGVLALDTRRAETLLRAQSGPLHVRFTPGSAGRWEVTVLESSAGESLPRAEGAPPLDGTRSPGGGSSAARIPARPGLGLQVSVDCVAGVALRLTAPGGTLATADRDPLADRPGPTELRAGRLPLVIRWPDLDRVGFRPDQRVRVTVRSVGRDTQQWRVVGAG